METLQLNSNLNKRRSNFISMMKKKEPLNTNFGEHFSSEAKTFFASFGCSDATLKTILCKSQAAINRTWSSYRSGKNVGAALAPAKRALRIVFVVKKIKSFCFCADYHRLIVVTAQHSYSTRGMNHFIDLLVEANRLSSLNSSSKFWQIQTDIIQVVTTASVATSVQHRCISTLPCFKTHQKQFNEQPV